MSSALVYLLVGYGLLLMVTLIYLMMGGTDE
jgi:hypothetical protein